MSAAVYARKLNEQEGAAAEARKRRQLEGLHGGRA
jgi:hypothetical protein